MCIIKTVGGDVNTRCCQEKEKEYKEKVEFSIKR